MNQVCLIGRLTRDPELRHTPSGNAVATFSIAVDGAGDYDEGEGKYAAGFFDCQAWGAQAENIAQYLEKGRQVGVSGSLRHHRWESQGGDKRSKVEINAFRVDFLGSKSDGGSGDQRFTPRGSAGTTDEQPAGSADFFGGDAPPTAAKTDDDIPF